MPFLPNHIFGYDTDELLSHVSPKSVWIRDRAIGVLYWSLICLVLFWVVVGQILWRNEHFRLKDVSGVARMELNAPVAHGCFETQFGPPCPIQFRSLEELPYCPEFAGNDPGVVHEHRSNPAKHGAGCVFADTRTLLPRGNTLDNSLFIPTSSMIVTETLQNASCPPLANLSMVGAHTECAGHYKRQEASQRIVKYYADIEHFTLQFLSSYTRQAVSGISLEHQGFYEDCSEPATLGASWSERMDVEAAKCESRGGTILWKPLFCATGQNCLNADESVLDDSDGADDVFLTEAAAAQANVVAMRAGMMRGGTVGSVATRASQAETDVFTTARGDRFELAKLLHLAGISLDLNTNARGEPIRAVGTVLTVEANYWNTYRFLSTFGYRTVEYSYKVKELMVPRMTREFLDVEQPANYPQSRRYIQQSGILVVFKVSGQFGFFNIVSLIFMLTSAMALSPPQRRSSILSLFICIRGTGIIST